MLQNYLLKIYVKDREPLELSEDLDCFPWAEEKRLDSLDLEDFWTDLEEIKEVVVWSRTEQRHIPSTIGIPERSWFLLTQFLEGN